MLYALIHEISLALSNEFFLDKKPSFLNTKVKFRTNNYFY